MRSLLSDSKGSLAFPKRMMVATDLTEGERLIPHVVAQAKASKAHVTLIHILETPKNEPERDTFTAEQQANSVVQGMACEITRHGLQCSLIVRSGVVEEIVQAEIVRTNTTRLAIGTHGHGHIGQQILGSVANALLRSVSVPVFVVGPHLE